MTSREPRPRNHVVDIARAVSVVVVVLFHGLLYQIRLDAGVPAVVPWAPGVVWWIISWFAMVMPVFFLAGGFAHALLVDRAAREGSGYGHFLANRGRRLVGPLILFVSVAAVVATVAAWAGWAAEASAFSEQVMQLLWFVTVYLAIVAAAPAMVRWHDRYGWPVILVLGVAAAAVDAWSFAVDNHEIRNLNLLLVWPLVHQLGIAYHRGWFRTGPARWAWAAVAVGVAGVVGLVGWAGYPLAAVGFADLPIANVQPPTLAMAFVALAQAGLMGLLERTGRLASVGAGTQKVLAVVNALMVTAYLWHIPVIFGVGGVLLVLSLAWPPAAPALLFQGTVAALSLAAVAALVPWIGRLEYRLIPPLGAVQDTRAAAVAYGVLLAGTALVWQNGVVLHPGTPASTLGVTLVWVGSWLMARAANADDSPAVEADPA